jgi:hypothetical protein
MEADSKLDASDPEVIQALYEEMDRLPAKYRSAIVLCELEGRTHAEVGRLLKCPTGTVSIRVSRGRELLRHRLTRRGLVLSVAAGLARGPQAAWANLPAGLADSTIKAVMLVSTGKAMAAGAVPAAVAQLIEGVTRTMGSNKLTIAATCLLAVATIPPGIGLFVRSAVPAQVDSSSQEDPAARAAAPAQKALPSTQAPASEVDDVNARRSSMDKLKTIGLAMHNFAASVSPNHFPAAAITKNGKPLLSWRVAILPYLDHKGLYDQFHLDEAWDSPHNRLLAEQIPDVYAPVTNKAEPRGNTYYQVLSGPGALFEGSEGPTLSEIADGTPWTILVVEAAAAVPWTKPEDVLFDKDKPAPALGGQFVTGFHVTFADGSARFIPKTIGASVLKALITPRGGETLRADMIP